MHKSDAYGVSEGKFGDGSEEALRLAEAFFAGDEATYAPRGPAPGAAERVVQSRDRESLPLASSSRREEQAEPARPSTHDAAAHSTRTRANTCFILLYLHR